MTKLVRYLWLILVSLPLIGLLSILWPAASLLLWAFGGGSERQLALGRVWAEILLGLALIRVRYIGLEYLDQIGPCVLVANHPSFIDIPVLCKIPVSGSIFAARRLFFHPFLCIQLRTSDHLPVGGANGDDSRRSVRRAICLIREARRSVLIFPEKIHLSPKLQPFQDGAGFIAIMAGAPIVPIALSGTRRFMGGAITVRIGEPIRTGGLGVCDRSRLATCLHIRVSEMLEVDKTAAAEDRT